MAGDAAARAIDPRTAWIMDDIRAAATYGTRRRARVLLKRNDIAARPAPPTNRWTPFSGYTPSLVATSWLGFDQPKSLGSRETGGGVAMPIWVDYMQTALAGVPEKSRASPDGIIVENGEYYFGIPAGTGGGPPGPAASRHAGRVLNGLGGGGEDNSIWRCQRRRPGQRPWSQKIPF